MVRIRSRYPAFTLAELMVSFAMAGTLGALMLPMLVNTAELDKLKSVAQDGIAQLEMAYNAYANNPGINPLLTTSGQIASKIPHYLRIINNGSKSTQVVVGSSKVTTTCNTVTPCLVLQSGALLQYSAIATFGTSLDPANNAMAFILDPDGSGKQAGVPLTLYLRGRISTHPHGTPTYGATNTLPLGTEDPDYVTSLLLEE